VFAASFAVQLLVCQPLRMHRCDAPRGTSLHVQCTWKGPILLAYSGTGSCSL
jgi:hypothetical protein